MSFAYLPIEWSLAATLSGNVDANPGLPPLPLPVMSSPARERPAPPFVTGVCGIKNLPNTGLGQKKPPETRWLRNANEKPALSAGLSWFLDRPVLASHSRGGPSK